MHRPKRGYSLLSVLISASVVVVLSGILASMIVTTARISTSTARKTEAIFLARSEMERLFVKDIHELESYEQDLAPEYPGFKKTVVVENIPGGKNIIVKIKYPGGSYITSVERYFET